MKFLVGIVIAILVLCCGGWFAASRWADGKIADVIEVQRQRGVEIDCADRAMGGFPFSMGVGCESITIRQPDGSQIDAGAVRSAASLTAPGEARIEIDSPFTVQSGRATLEAHWRKLEAFADATFDGGFERVSFSSHDLTIASGDISVILGSVSGKALRSKAYEKDRNSDGLYSQISLNDVTARLPNDISIPHFSIDMDGTLDDGYRDFVVRRLTVAEVMADGAHGVLQSAKLEMPNDGKLVLAGPFELGADGLLSGKVKVGIANPKAVKVWARAVSPALEQPASLLAKSVAEMGAETTLGGEEVRAIELTIDKGEVRLGFIKLLDLPALR
ncbi:MAG: DUF2125 domain-containing protein [Rhizobiaceae bacterium]